MAESCATSCGIRPRLSLDRVVSIVRQIGSALDAAHARGLVHRDVKPGNVLVTRQAEAEEPDLCYLTDFGVSTWTSSSAATITGTGQLVGTVNYVAPEQIEGARVDGRADLYSLGCVLYECLTGRPPFAGRPPAAVLYAHLHEEAPGPTSLRPDLPPPVDAVVARALRRAPEERYPSARDLTLELRAALAGSAPSSTNVVLAPPSRPSTGSRARRRAGWMIASVAAAVLVAAAAIAVLALNGRGPASSTGPTRTPDLIREGVQVTASETAPASTDAAGNVVTYLPANVIDGDVQTAWRTPGDGHRESVTLIFDNPVDVVRIGLIPGYAKTDPQTGANRFFQNRIITEVRYLIPGLPPIEQTLRPVPVPQFVDVDATTSRIDVVVVATTEPGGLDYTAISEIYVYGYPQ